MPKSLPATITLADADLARLLPSTGADAGLLAEVRDLLRDVRDRLDAPMQPLLVTQDEAGKLMGVSGRTAWDLAEAGELDVVWPGPNCRRISVASIKAWIERQKSKPQASHEPRGLHLQRRRIGACENNRRLAAMVVSQKRTGSMAIFADTTPKSKLAKILARARFSIARRGSGNVRCHGNPARPARAAWTRCLCGGDRTHRATASPAEDHPTRISS